MSSRNRPLSTAKFLVYNHILTKFDILQKLVFNAVLWTDCVNAVTWWFTISDYFPAVMNKCKTTGHFCICFFGMCHTANTAQLKPIWSLNFMVQGRERQFFETAFQALPSSPFVTMFVRILCCSNFDIKITFKSYLLIIILTFWMIFASLCSLSISLALHFKNNKFRCFLLD